MGRVNTFTSTYVGGYADKLVKETVTEKYDDEGNVVERTTEKVYERVYHPQAAYPNYIITNS